MSNRIKEYFRKAFLDLKIRIGIIKEWIKDNPYTFYRGLYASIILVFLVIITISAQFSKVITSKTVVIKEKVEVPVYPKKLEVLSEDKKIAKMRRDWEYYTQRLKKEELEVYWYNTFKDVTYRRGGSAAKFKTADCSDASYHLLRKFGYPGLMHSVKDTRKLATQLARVGLVKFRHPSRAQCGDLILFKRNRNGIPHMGIVTQTRNRYVMYVDVNAMVGMSIRSWVSFNDRRIDKIIPVSWDFWMADYNIMRSRKRN